MKASLSLKKLQTPPGNSYAYYYRPPLAEGQGGGLGFAGSCSPYLGPKATHTYAYEVGLVIPNMGWRLKKDYYKV